MPSTHDLRGAARLATDATAGLVDLVEAMHERIARVPGLGGVLDGRTTGITGLVYKTVRGVTRVVGGSVDALLGLVTPALREGESGPARDAVIAALNGVLGDHLEATHNPLATAMTLRHQGQALTLEREALRLQLPAAGPHLLVLVHGLCMNHLQWQRQGHDHGELLARERGDTPVYLHYNSGRAIASNGEEFGRLMQRLVDAWPVPLQSVTLLTHSMGGLVARSALHQAAAAGMAWPQQLRDIVFLGTPHQGAPLERAGHWVDILLGATPYAAPLARLGRVRSAGITDLRHGLALPLVPPQLARLRAWAVAGTLAEAPHGVKDKLLGDGLVPLASALGAGIPPDRQFIARDTHHMALLDSPAVAAQLLAWLTPQNGQESNPPQDAA
jgi:hypothetical protein